MDVEEALEALVVVVVVIFFFAMLYKAFSFTQFVRSTLPALAGYIGAALVAGLALGVYAYWRSAIRRKE